MVYRRWRYCRCGCGQQFEAYGRRDYISNSHKQKDYRRRKQAKLLAWKYVAEVCQGDMSYFSTAWEAYYSQLLNGETIAVVT